MKTRHIQLLMDSLVSSGLADIELEEDVDIELEADEPVFAADKRVTDVDGRLHVDGCNLSKSNVCKYFGRELPGWEALGLDAGSMYALYRDPKELAAAAASFENLPVMMDHIASTADQPQKQFIVGTVSNVRFKTPYLIGDISFWDADAIRVIESGEKQELSAGYRYLPDMTPGTSPQGEIFDGVMRQIAANHLALVVEGRAGPDVMVKDSAN